MDELSPSSSFLRVDPASLHFDRSPWTWSVDDVCIYIRACGYREYEHCFRGNFVDGPRFMRIVFSNLRELGIKPFPHQREIMLVIEHAQNMGKFSTSRLQQRRLERQLAQQAKDERRRNALSRLDDLLKARKNGEGNTFITQDDDDGEDEEELDPPSLMHLAGWLRTSPDFTPANKDKLFVIAKRLWEDYGNGEVTLWQTPQPHVLTLTAAVRIVREKDSWELIWLSSRTAEGTCCDGSPWVVRRLHREQSAEDGAIAALTDMLGKEHFGVDQIKGIEVEPSRTMKLDKSDYEMIAEVRKEQKVTITVEGLPPLFFSSWQRNEEGQLISTHVWRWCPPGEISDSARASIAAPKQADLSGDSADTYEVLSSELFEWLVSPLRDLRMNIIVIKQCCRKLGVFSPKEMTAFEDATVGNDDLSVEEFLLHKATSKPSIEVLTPLIDDTYPISQYDSITLSRLFPLAKFLKIQLLQRLENGIMLLVWGDHLGAVVQEPNLVLMQPPSVIREELNRYLRGAVMYGANAVQVVASSAFGDSPVGGMRLSLSENIWGDPCFRLLAPDAGVPVFLNDMVENEMMIADKKGQNDRNNVTVGTDLLSDEENDNLEAMLGVGKTKKKRLATSPNINGNSKDSNAGKAVNCNQKRAARLSWSVQYAINYLFSSVLFVPCVGNASLETANLVNEYGIFEFMTLVFAKPSDSVKALMTSCDNYARSLLNFRSVYGHFRHVLSALQTYRESEGEPRFFGKIHGNLQWSNILVGADGAVWMTQLGKYGTGHVLSDLAQLEAEMLFSLTPLNDTEELEDIIGNFNDILPISPLSGSGAYGIPAIGNLNSLNSISVASVESSKGAGAAAMASSSTPTKVNPKGNDSKIASSAKKIASASPAKTTSSAPTPNKRMPPGTSSIHSPSPQRLRGKVEETKKSSDNNQQHPPSSSSNAISTALSDMMMVNSSSSSSSEDIHKAFSEPRSKIAFTLLCVKQIRSFVQVYCNGDDDPLQYIIPLLSHALKSSVNQKNSLHQRQFAIVAAVLLSAKLLDAIGEDGIRPIPSQIRNSSDLQSESGSVNSSSKKNIGGDDINNNGGGGGWQRMPAVDKDVALTLTTNLLREAVVKHGHHWDRIGRRVIDVLRTPVPLQLMVVSSEMTRGLHLIDLEEEEKLTLFRKRWNAVHKPTPPVPVAAGGDPINLRPHRPHSVHSYPSQSSRRHSVHSLRQESADASEGNDVAQNLASLNDTGRVFGEAESAFSPRSMHARSVAGGGGGGGSVRGEDMVSVDGTPRLPPQDNFAVKLGPSVVPDFSSLIHLPPFNPTPAPPATPIIQRDHSAGVDLGVILPSGPLPYGWRCVILGSCGSGRSFATSKLAASIALLQMNSSDAMVVPILISAAEWAKLVRRGLMMMNLNGNGEDGSTKTANTNDKNRKNGNSNTTKTSAIVDAVSSAEGPEKMSEEDIAVLSGLGIGRNEEDEDEVDWLDVFLAHRFKRGSLRHMIISELRSRDQLVYVIDGLEQAEPSTLPHLQSCLARELVERPHLRMAITCSETSMVPQPLLAVSTRWAVLSPLPERTVEEIVDDQLGNGSDSSTAFLEELRQSPELMEFVQCPLMLRAAIHIFYTVAERIVALPLLPGKIKQLQNVNVNDLLQHLTQSLKPAAAASSRKSTPKSADATGSEGEDEDEGIIKRKQKERERALAAKRVIAPGGGPAVARGLLDAKKLLRTRADWMKRIFEALLRFDPLRYDGGIDQIAVTEIDNTAGKVGNNKPVSSPMAKAAPSSSSGDVATVHKLKRMASINASVRKNAQGGGGESPPPVFCAPVGYWEVLGTLAYETHAQRIREFSSRHLMRMLKQWGNSEFDIFTEYLIERTKMGDSGIWSHVREEMVLELASSGSFSSGFGTAVAANNNNSARKDGGGSGGASVAGGGGGGDVSATRQHRNSSSAASTPGAAAVAAAAMMRMGSPAGKMTQNTVLRFANFITQEFFAAWHIGACLDRALSRRESFEQAITNILSTVDADRKLNMLEDQWFSRVVVIAGALMEEKTFQTFASWIANLDDHSTGVNIFRLFRSLKERGVPLGMMTSIEDAIVSRLKQIRPRSFFVAALTHPSAEVRGIAVEELEEFTDLFAAVGKRHESTAGGGSDLKTGEGGESAKASSPKSAAPTPSLQRSDSLRRGAIDVDNNNKTSKENGPSSPPSVPTSPANTQSWSLHDVDSVVVALRETVSSQNISWPARIAALRSLLVIRDGKSGPGDIPFLLDLLLEVDFPAVQQEAMWAIRELEVQNDSKVIRMLLICLDAGIPSLTLSTYRVIAALGVASPQICDALVSVISDGEKPSIDTRAAALRALSFLPEPMINSAREVVLQCLSSSLPVIQISAIKAIKAGNFHDKTVLALLERVCADVYTAPEVKADALRALRTVTEADTSALESLHAWLIEIEDALIRLKAAQSFHRPGVSTTSSNTAAAASGVGGKRRGSVASTNSGAVGSIPAAGTLQSTSRRGGATGGVSSSKSGSAAGMFVIAGHHIGPQISPHEGAVIDEEERAQRRQTIQLLSELVKSAMPLALQVAEEMDAAKDDRMANLLSRIRSAAADSAHSSFSQGLGTTRAAGNGAGTDTASRSQQEDDRPGSGSSSSRQTSRSRASSLGMMPDPVDADAVIAALASTSPGPIDGYDNSVINDLAVSIKPSGGNGPVSLLTTTSSSLSPLSPLPLTSPVGSMFSPAPSPATSPLPQHQQQQQQQQFPIRRPFPDEIPTANVSSGGDKFDDVPRVTTLDEFPKQEKEVEQDKSTNSPSRRPAAVLLRGKTLLHFPPRASEAAPRAAAVLLASKIRSAQELGSIESVESLQQQQQQLSSSLMKTSVIFTNSTNNVAAAPTTTTSAAAFGQHEHDSMAIFQVSTLARHGVPWDASLLEQLALTVLRAGESDLSLSVEAYRALQSLRIRNDNDLHVAFSLLIDSPARAYVISAVISYIREQRHNGYWKPDPLWENQLITAAKSGVLECVFTLRELRLGAPTLADKEDKNNAEAPSAAAAAAASHSTPSSPHLSHRAGLNDLYHHHHHHATAISSSPTTEYGSPQQMPLLFSVDVPVCEEVADYVLHLSHREIHCDAWDCAVEVCTDIIEMAWQLLLSKQLQTKHHLHPHEAGKIGSLLMGAHIGGENRTKGIEGLRLPV